MIKINLSTALKSNKVDIGILKKLGLIDSQVYHILINLVKKDFLIFQIRSFTKKDLN